MKELNYPFDVDLLTRKRKQLRRELQKEIENKKLSLIKKNIAILGGQTTENIKQMMELFLLNQGIQPCFYESEYNQWFEDGAFPNKELEEFAPDIIYMCTCIRNIQQFPALHEDALAIDEKLTNIYDKFVTCWKHLSETYHCPIVQNNFEYPYFRVMGNRDASDVHGRVNFVTRLNCKLYEYASAQEGFYICDVNYLSASYGLDKWADPYYWHMFKYAVAVPAIPYLSYNVSNIIKSIFGKNKKVLNLDLDNTLWGGIVGDDGSDNIEIGQETPLAQTYSEFQEYLRLQSQLGILLSINSKNQEENAFAGLARSDSVLHQEDFVNIKANWNPKSQNLLQTAEELALLPESFVFVDDNPAERAIIEAQVPGVAIPPLESPEHYIQVIDKSGFFEVTNFSKEDLQRKEMYLENAKRAELQASFHNYEEYLHSLQMSALIEAFIPPYYARISQLTNKSNQFNLTTKRMTLEEVAAAAVDEDCITLYGKLQDKFGDNGVVSLAIGKRNIESPDTLDLELWLMSCRVLKRDMEFAMMDELVHQAKRSRYQKIRGYYYPTAKNVMVKDFYEKQGFYLLQEDSSGNTVWEYVIPEHYEIKQHVIAVNAGGVYGQEKGYRE